MPMSGVMVRRLAVMLGAVAATMLLTTAGAWAAVANTGGASVRSSTLAVVYGTADPSTADAAWFFQYGTDQQNLSQMTQPVPFSQAGWSGTLSKSLANLTPSTTYYYRLVVEQTADDPASASYGATLTFTTAAAGYRAATTLGADTVTATSEQLHGVVDALDSNSGWVFEYATDSAFTHPSIAPSHGQPIGAGVAEVQVLVKGLTAHTKYYYRLLVGQGSDPATLDEGDTKTFTAGASSSPPPKSGTASLPGHRLKVHSGVVSIPLKCAGTSTATCTGTLSLTAAKGTACARTSFNVHGGVAKTLRATVSSACERLLRRASRHTLKATAKLAFTSAQRRITAAVTLVGI